MTTLADQIEALRQRVMSTTTTDLDLVRSLRTSLEQSDAALAAELHATIEGHKHRRWALAGELAALAHHLGSMPVIPAGPPPMPVEEQPMPRIARR